MNVVELLYRQVKENPHKVALVESTKTVTYAQLGQSIQQTAYYFKSKSITKGDRVLIVVPMSINTYRIVLALLYIGAVPVFMEEWAFKNNFYNNTQFVNCKAVIVAKKFKVIAWFSKTIRSIPIKLSSSKIGEDTIGIAKMDTNDSALLSFTSGSSGQPKVADRSHGFLLEQFRVLKEVTQCKGTENVCVGLAVVVLFYLAQGNTIVLRTSKLLKTPQKLNDLLKTHQVNQIIDSPAKLLQYATHLSQNQANQITQTFCGGGPVFSQDAVQLNSIFSKSTNTVIYGSTEVEPISVVNCDKIINASEQNQNGLCVGKVNVDLKLKIIKLNQPHQHKITLKEFEKQNITNSEIGEIIVCGNHVLNTYFKSDDVIKSQKIYVDNTVWHKTGDSGYLIDSVLYLTGQCSALIQNNKSIISPFIVEQQLREIEGVNKGTVIEKDSKLIVVIESELPIGKLNITLPFEFDTIKKVAKIPMDVRHNTKIDYQELKKIT